MGAPRASQVLLRSGTAEQKRQAGTVIPVRRPRRAGLLRLSRGRCTSRAVAFGFDAAFAPAQLVKKGHQLLVTLLLMNAAAMEVRRRARPRTRSAAAAEPRRQGRLTRVARGVLRRADAADLPGQAA